MAASFARSPRPHRTTRRCRNVTRGDRTVLVVEDNQDHRVILKTWLEHAGYGVLLALDGPTGVQLARVSLPDVILMDVALPGADGWAAARELKADAATKGIPIIALSALAVPQQEA